MTIAYKFTMSNRRPKYSDYPAIGEWSEKRIPVLCRSGWHVPVLLSEWIMPELWKVEVRGESVGDDQKIAFEQMRFLEKVEDWDVLTMRDFITHCCNRAAYAAAYDAFAAAYAAAYDAFAAYDAAAARRRYQHNWIVGRLNLGRAMEVPE